MADLDDDEDQQIHSMKKMTNEETFGLFQVINEEEEYANQNHKKPKNMKQFEESKQRETGKFDAENGQREQFLKEYYVHNSMGEGMHDKARSQAIKISNTNE